eukprot:237158-Pyramimonas_sp.AAC.1
MNRAIVLAPTRRLEVALQPERGHHRELSKRHLQQLHSNGPAISRGVPLLRIDIEVRRGPNPDTSVIQ